MNTNIPLGDVPPALWIGIGVLTLVQIVLEVWALVTLLRTPDERLVFGKKWPWVLIIVFVNTIGAIVFFVAGRTAPPAAEPVAPAVEAGDRATHAADVLYGRSEGEEPRP